MLYALQRLDLCDRVAHVAYPNHGVENTSLNKMVIPTITKTAITINFHDSLNVPQ